MIGQAIFLLISLITLGAAVGVVMSRTVFVSALWLVLSFVGVAGIYVLLGAHFLAAIQVLVYVGAISVLILFAIMLTRNVMSEEHVINNQWVLALVAATSVFGTLVTLAYGADWPLTWPPGGPGIDAAGSAAADSGADAAYATVETIGISLMSEHLLAFEVVSVVLLVALIGAIVIARD